MIAKIAGNCITGVKAQTYVVFAYSTGPCVNNIHNQSQKNNNCIMNSCSQAALNEQGAGGGRKFIPVLSVL